MTLNQSMDKDDYLLLALSFVDGIGVIRANQLIQHFGSVASVFEAKAIDFSTLSFLNKKIVQQIVEKTSFQKADMELEFALKHGVEILTLNHARYPARLKTLEDKPLVLYAKGNVHPQIKKTLAIIGTRKSTDYGAKFLEDFFEELKSIQDIAVISGLAMGIDYKAHKLCLKHQIPTIAVMGVALHSIYPAYHKSMAEEILATQGGWITETSSQDYINQGVFPKRNRIIAGMSDALFVVETNLKGGSMITANLGNDYNKEVFALPGRINDNASKGCNHLIQTNRALLVNKPTDIPEVMQWKQQTNKNVPMAIELDFNGTALQNKLVNILRNHPKIDIEKLSEYTHLTSSELAESLVTLELDSIIRTLPGNKYELI